jgi:hypothetical protein
MPLDCHLFADLQEGAAKNVAITYHIKMTDEDVGLKYSFAMPAKVYESLQRTVAAGCPSPKRIAEDIKQIFEETLGHIVEAEGCYIEDDSKKIVRSRVRAEVAQQHKHETIPVDASAMTRFNTMVEKMQNGGGVSFLFDMTNDDGFDMPNDTLTTVPLPDDDDDDGGGDDDNNDDLYEVEEEEGDEPAR